MARIVFEVAVEDIGTEGLREDMDLLELDLWDLLRERIRGEVVLAIDVFESDNEWTIAGHSGLIVGARLEGDDGA